MSDELNKFDEAKETDQDFPMQDKITTKLNAKGEIQAEVRIGGELTTEKDIDDLVGLHKHAWDIIRSRFPNLVKPKLSPLGGE